MNPKTQQRLEALLATFDSGAVQPEELIKAIDAVMAIVKQSNETIAKKVGDNDTATKKRIETLESEVDQALRRLENYSTTLNADKATKSDIERLQSNLTSEIKRVSALIPDLPDEFDASDIYSAIEGHKDLIENISSLIVGENLRNALEALPEGDKLAIEAVEGLREELDKLAKNWNRGGGGGLGSQIVLDIINQAVADGTIPSGGSSTFLALTDTPSDYTGQAGKAVVVNLAEDALEFVAPTGTGTVTSVAVSGSDGIEVDSGSPITAAGTIALGVNKTNLLTHINVEDGAEVNNISDANATDLTDGGDSTLHFHSADRNRANHTGTQIASTISDFQTAVSANTDVAANTSARHSAVTVSGTPDYITLVGQDIVRGQIDLATDVTGDLPFANLTQLSAHSVLGRSGAGTGDVAGITMGNNTILGRSGSGDVDDLSASQVRTILNVADGATANAGTVTSVAMTVPTGLTISGSPVTSSGTLAVGLDTDRVIPTQATLDAKVDYLLTSEASSATPTATGTALRNDYVATALTVNATLAAPSGTANANAVIRYRITASGGTRTIGYNAGLLAGNITRTTSLATGETLTQVYHRVGSTWVCVFEDVTS